MKNAIKQALPALALAAVASFFAASAFAGPARADFADPTFDSNSSLNEYAQTGMALREHLWPANVSVRMPMGTIFESLISRNQDDAGRSRVLAALETVLAFAATATLCDSLYPALAVALLMRPSLVPMLKFNGPLEEPYALLLILIAGLLAWRSRRPSLAKTWILSASIGLSLLFISPLVLFPPLLALFEWTVVHRFSRSYWKQAAVICLAPYALLVPWIWMNWTVYHVFSPFENAAASNNIVIAALGLALNLSGKPYWVMGVTSCMDVGRYDSVIRWALGEIASHPARYLYGCMERWEFVFSLEPVA